jgi:chemotaxis methyl-accepting protein methylase
MSDAAVSRAIPRYEPPALRPVWHLWRLCPRGLRRALQRTGIPYVLGYLARYPRAHSLENFAGFLPELKCEYLRAPAEQRAGLAARFDAIVDRLVMPNGVSKTTYFRRQEQILARVLAHEGCALNGRPLRVLDIPSSAGTGSLRSYAVLAERYPVERYVLGDLYFDIVVDRRRRCVFDEHGRLLQAASRKRFFSVYRTHTEGEVHTWLTALVLAPLDLHAAYLKKRYRYAPSGDHVRIRVLHPDAAALVSDGVFRLAQMDVFEGIEGTYDLILSFNLLQRNYFPPQRIALGVANLGRALEEGGLLVIGDTESFAVLRKRGGRLFPVLQQGEFRIEEEVHRK